MRWIFVVVALAGCYSPQVEDCAQSCGAGNSCAAGLTCAEGVCRVPSRMGTSCTTADAPDVVTDVPVVVDVPPESCTWDLVSTNFDAADLPTQRPALTILTDTTFTTGQAGGVAVAQTGAPDLWLVHYAKLTVAVGATLTIEGMHPLVIAADEIDIQGTVVANNGLPPASCNAVRGANVCDKATGGGGGGYGGVGGDGGGALGMGGTVANIEPMPLRSGCPGGQGGDGRTGAGDVNARLGGLGGAGGGALQLSGRLRVTIDGDVLANGYGGLPGVSDPAGGGACGVTGRAAGGGGGGGGGMLFVESCETIIQPTARLCANGGGGGGGSGGGNTNTGIRGVHGNCAVVAGGGAGEIANSQGGPGGFDGTYNGGAGAIASRGGGGGGGAVGRIHIRQVAGAPVTTGAVIRPPANRSQ